MIAASLSAAPEREPRTVPAASDLVAYDRSLPLDVRRLGTHENGDVAVTRLTFASINPSRGRVAARVLRPSGEGPFAGVVYIRQLERTSSKHQSFVEEAAALARFGVVAAVVDGYVVSPDAPAHAAAVRRLLIDYTIDARRAVDLLVAEPGVDPRRIGVVGHDSGAVVGTIMAAIDRRASCYVLMAATSDASAWALRNRPSSTPDSVRNYQRTLAVLNPINFVGIASPAALLFQFARRDAATPEAIGTELFDEASQPKDIRWYDSGHDLDVEAALADRVAWLTRQLKVNDFQSPR